MKTFSYKNETFTCEIVHKNTNSTAKSKCVRIITENGVRNIYTIANGYTKPVAYCKNSIVLSDIVIGKAFSILGLMNGGDKFIFSKDAASSDTTTVSNKVNTNIVSSSSSLTTMYRVIDVNTNSIAMFSSELDVVTYCIGRTVKVDKIEISTGLDNVNTINEDYTADDVNNDTDINVDDNTVVNTPITNADVDVSVPKRKGKSNYTKPSTNQDSSSEKPIDVDVQIDVKNECELEIDNAPVRKRRS